MKKLNIKKKIGVFCAALGLAAALSGCMIAASPDELYSLPKLPDEFVELEDILASLVGKGYEYAAPTGGDNIQMVQIVDIDGDGTDEAVAFLRKSDDAKPMKIYVFKQYDGKYRVASVIEESAASIDQVDYCDINGNGILEIIVGWRMTNTDGVGGRPEDNASERTLTRLVSAYNLERYNCQKVLETGYNRYVLTDLDRNSIPELITIVGDGSGTCSAVLYEWSTGGMQQVCTANLSVPPAMLDGVRTGGLTGGKEALFVTGVVDEQNRITDVLVLDQNILTNCVMDKQSGTSRLVYRNLSVQARDINDDGVLEIPIAYELPKVDGASDTYWGLHWTAFSNKGNPQVAETTYHDLTDGWYLVLPESWKDVLMVTNVSSSRGERAVTFGVYRGEKTEPLDILTIYTETGDNREYKANKSNRFILARQTTAIYAAEFLPGYSTWSGAMSESALKDAFYLVRTEWYAR